MNFNNFTIKSQEAIQRAQQLAQSYGHQQIENEHLFQGILEVDENVLPFLLKKESSQCFTAKAGFRKNIGEFSEGKRW